MGLINVVLKQLVLSEGCRAHCTLVGEVGGLEDLLVVLVHVVEQLPLEDLAADRASARVLTLIGEVLHRGRHEAVRAEQVPLEALVGEEPELALLAVERGPVVDHLGVDLDLVDPEHVVAQLLQILDVAVADLADDKVALAGAAGRTGLGTRGSVGACAGAAGGEAVSVAAARAAGKGRDGDGGGGVGAGVAGAVVDTLKRRGRKKLEFTLS